MQTILVCGAGIAGPTLAYWLKRAGFSPTIVERAPALRSSGYVIDFWGIGSTLPRKWVCCQDFSVRDITLKNSVSSTTAAVVSRASEQKYLMILPEVDSFQ